MPINPDIKYIIGHATGAISWCKVEMKQYFLWLDKYLYYCKPFINNGFFLVGIYRQFRILLLIALR
jgi:hypothetical protein